MKKYKCEKCRKENISTYWQKICYECDCKEIKERFECGLEDDGENEIHCPKCHGIYDIADEVGLYEKDEHQLHCQECGGSFIATTDMVKGFSTKKGDKKCHVKGFMITRAE